MSKKLIGLNCVKFFIRCPFHGLELVFFCSVKHIWTSHGLASTFKASLQKISNRYNGCKKTKYDPRGCRNMWYKMRVLASKIGHQLFCMVCGEWFPRFPTGYTCCTMLYHMFLSLGCTMNCARVCSSRPKLFATKSFFLAKPRWILACSDYQKPQQFGWIQLGSFCFFCLSRPRLQ